MTENNHPSRAKETAGSRGKGILFILLAAFFFSLMSVFVRLSGDVPTMQKAFFRNIVAAAVALIILIRSGIGRPLRRDNFPPLLLRSIFGTAGILANFWAVDHLGIADANMLNKLSPFFAILMSIFILGEKPSRIEWLSVLLAFIGAAFVAKPSSGIISVPALVGAFGGFAAGTAYTFGQGASGSEGAGRRRVFLTFFNDRAPAQFAAELHTHDNGAVCLPAAGRMLCRRRAALCDGGISACPGARHLRI